MNTTLTKTKKLTYSAMFAAIATLVMYLDFPLPFMPPFLKLDLSGFISILTAFMFGAVPAILVTLTKDIIHAFSSTTGGVGELADFLMMSAFSIAVSFSYKRNHTKKGAIIGLSIGTVITVIIGMLTNKYMLIPFFSKVTPIETIIEMCTKVNPSIDSINTYIVFGVLPFNLIKCFILSLITVLVYKRLSVFINSTHKFSKTTANKAQNV